jgi:hypothetical protein
MQPGESYRLKSETLGISTTDRSRTAVIIPKDSIVTIVAGPFEGERLVDVIWNGKTIMLFAQDLRERGELVDGAGS